MEIPADTIEHALKEARARGIVTVLNTAPFTTDVPRLAGLADIIISNETEFDLLAGLTASGKGQRLDALMRLHEQSGQIFVLTLGADGAIAIKDGEIIQANSLKIDPVDTVGAGDTFCGYLVGGLEQGLDIGTALQRAAAAGSIACLSAGAQTAIPMAAAVEAALAAT